MAVIQGWLLFRGLVSYYGSLCSQVYSGPELVARYIAYGCVSGVAVKRGSTVHLFLYGWFLKFMIPDV